MPSTRPNLGEYYDLASDKMNRYAGPLTGGSKVIVSGDITPSECKVLGYASVVVAGTILSCLLPNSCWLIGAGLMFIAHQYSAPPFKFNHCGLGELAASLATNVLLPQFAALVLSTPLEEGPTSLLMIYSSSGFVALVIPAFFLKLGLFVALNMADRRPDWLVGKKTIPVIFGDEVSSRCVYSPVKCQKYKCYYCHIEYKLKRGSC